MISKNTKISVKEILRYQVFAIYIANEKLEPRLYKGILKVNKI